MVPKAKAKIVQDVTRLVLARRPRMCSVIEYKGEPFLDACLSFPFFLTIDFPGSKVIYRQYASLYFICEIGELDNELITLEIIHRFVEILDRYFGNVCELDLIFNFQKAYAILDELIVAGELQDSNKNTVLTTTQASDGYEQDEYVADALRETFLF